MRVRQTEGGQRQALGKRHSVADETSIPEQQAAAAIQDLGARIECRDQSFEKRILGCRNMRFSSTRGLLHDAQAHRQCIHPGDFMHFETWLLYLLTCCGISVVPGPNALLVLSHGGISCCKRLRWR